MDVLDSGILRSFLVRFEHDFGAIWAPQMPSWSKNRTPVGAGVQSAGVRQHGMGIGNAKQTEEMIFAALAREAEQPVSEQNTQELTTS